MPYEIGTSGNVEGRPAGIKNRPTNIMIKERAQKMLKARLKDAIAELDTLKGEPAMYLEYYCRLLESASEL